ncbi:MAG: hypothetical protein DBX91_10355 [Subdoligranulum variabile]|nr:MAG: hypothetical protein DBX91_10355 [Subdoligranulum variabile]
MAFERISEEELAGVGVELLPDLPELAPDAMKAKFEETAKKLLAPKHNKLAEQMEAETAAANLGAEVPGGLDAETARTVQAVLAALMLYIQAHEQKKDNPHAVTAEQVGAYTKQQTDKAINDKVVEIGGGDMQQAVYDPEGERKPIYPAIAEAVEALRKLVMEKKTYDPQEKGQDVFATIDAAAPQYEAILRLDGWVTSTSEEQAQGYPWAQEATLTALTPGAPVVTAASRFLSGCTRTPVGPAETDAILDEALNLVNARGITRSLDGGKIRTIIEEKPESDVALKWLIRTEVS